ncbi:hypothetical protein L6452_27304 [Arctium lappa]|uniref:Uncharacterized protein n=1 Tax=Arctium lappa TaxID=4217 RepID=A0ACB8ZWE9_ARCLA|nr:hypothetical protein L6452_27304 [Arctium lappa]
MFDYASSILPLYFHLHQSCGIDVGLEENGNNEENVEPTLVDEGNMIDDVEVDMTNLEDIDSESDSDFESTRKKRRPLEGTVSVGAGGPHDIFRMRPDQIGSSLFLLQFKCIDLCMIRPVVVPISAFACFFPHDSQVHLY